MKKVLVTLGEGGHTAPMLRLVGMLGKAYRYSYVVVRGDPVSERKIKTQGRVFRVTRPRTKAQGRLVAVLNTLLNFFESLAVLLRARPYAIMTAGPGMALPLMVWGKLLRRKIVYVECSSRVSTKSATGKWVEKLGLAGLFFVQWETMTKVYPKSIYKGRLTG